MPDLNPDFGEPAFRLARGALPDGLPISPSDITDPKSWDEFMDLYRHWEKKLEQKLFEIPEYKGRKAIWGQSPEEFDPFRMNMMPLDWQNRAPFLAEFKELTGINDLLSDRLEGEGTPARGAKFPTLFTDRETRSPAGRFQITSIYREDGSIDPYMLFLSQITLPHDRTEGGAKAFNLTANLPRAAMLENLKRQMENPGMHEGKRFLVFDIETPGLLVNQAPWQLSARMVSSRGEQLGDALDLRFASRDMSALGVVWNEKTKKVESVQDYVQREHHVQDLPEGLMQFFALANQDDVVLGGHNIQFDVQRIVHNAKLHPAYAENPEFRDAVDKFIGKIYSDGKIHDTFRDTLSIARADLTHITPNEYLSTEARGRQWSMQNLLLQTDLFERAQKASEAEVLSAIDRGVSEENLPLTAREFLVPQEGATTRHQLHQADVDTFFERYLAEAQLEKGAGGPGLQYNALQDEEVRNAILKARPFGPSIPLNDWSLIEPGMHQRIRDMGLVDEVGNPDITPLEYMVMRQRHIGLVKENPLFQDRSMIDMAEGGLGNRWRRFRRRFWDVDAPDTMEQVGYQAGLWKRLSKDWTEDRDIISGNGNVKATMLSRDATAPFPDEEMWQAAQQEMSSKGIPFAGLSWLERHLAATLGQNWAPVEGEGISKAQEQARDIFGATAGVGKFIPHTDFGVVAREKKAVVKLPEEVMARILDEGSALEHPLFSSKQQHFWALDPFPFRQKKQVAFKFTFDQDKDKAIEQKEFILQHLRENLNGGEEYAQKYGLTGEGIEEIETAFKRGVDAYGVQVGLFHARPTVETQKVYEALVEAMGRNVMGSDQTPLAHVLRLGKGWFGGAFIKPEGMNEEEIAAATQQGRYGQHLMEEAFHQDKLPFMNLFKRLAETGADEGKLWSTYRKVQKRMPIIGAATAVTGLGYYAYKRHKRRDHYEQPLFTAPLEPGPPPAQQRPAPQQTQLYPTTYNGSSGRNSVNLTGGVMQTLDRNKIQHTFMGPSKYDNLYQGVS